MITAVPANPVVWPECEAGESLSFRLRNIREAKNRWENGQTINNPTQFNHFTDTRIVLGVELHARRQIDRQIAGQPEVV